MLNTHKSSSPQNSVSHPNPLMNRAEDGLYNVILEYSYAQPEVTVLFPEGFSHLGSQKEIRQALSELAEGGILNRIHENLYVRPVQTRFGACSPNFEDVIPNLANLWKETIVPSGSASANALGMTTQVPVRPVYLTSGQTKTLRFGNLSVELRHAPDWQLVAPGHPAGDVIRALAWLGPEEVQERLELIKKSMSIRDIKAVTESCPTMPEWITGPVSRMATNV